MASSMCGDRTSTSRSAIRAARESGADESFTWPSSRIAHARHGGEVRQSHNHDLPQLEGLFQTNLLGRHYACSSCSARVARSINETGREARESRAPGRRTPAMAGWKALRCPMLFLTECGVGRLLPISLSFPGVIRPRLWVCSLVKKEPMPLFYIGSFSGGALCICRAPLTRKKGGKIAFICTGERSLSCWSGQHGLQ